MVETLIPQPDYFGVVLVVWDVLFAEIGQRLYLSGCMEVGISLDKTRTEPGSEVYGLFLTDAELSLLIKM